MGNSKGFRFKQFAVRHDRCAMKTGTDGVLLGAWATVCMNKAATRILDVGTGCGLIALMAAQRNPHAVIDAIDIDRETSQQAAENVARSPFADRIMVCNASFFDFADCFVPRNDGYATRDCFVPRNDGYATRDCFVPRNDGYDLVISNPPFFQHSLKSTNTQRNTARHDETLPLKPFITQAATILAPDGIISLILPVDLSEQLEIIAASNALHICRRTDVVSVANKLPKRFLVELSKRLPDSYDCSILTLETTEHKKTAQYQELTSEFYL